MKRYCVLPGYVVSVHDGQRHYVGAARLMRLYHVNAADCVIITPSTQSAYSCGSALVPLAPRADGKYEVPS